jgi:hypothetical protein
MDVHPHFNDISDAPFLLGIKIPHAPFSHKSRAD